VSKLLVLLVFAMLLKPVYTVFVSAQSDQFISIDPNDADAPDEQDSEETKISEVDDIEKFDAVCTSGSLESNQRLLGFDGNQHLVADLCISVIDPPPEFLTLV
jgi:hypothetical protein